MLLDESFYIRENVVKISRELLGKVLVTNFRNKITSGIITETEAYAGAEDKASHAYNNRRTPRTEIMFGNGGTAYVYLCYGIHSLFNVVTNKETIPHAVLIRSIFPLEGIDIMRRRRGLKSPKKNFATGPGTVSQALGIHYSHSGESLLGNKIRIEDKGIKISSSQIQISKRIGVDYAGKDALLPYRFLLIINKIAADSQIKNFQNLIFESSANIFHLCIPN
ncbi:MAG: DNA-3-methyladenine glycosylase [Bacteroidia bacterium]|nr:DNA-3-methyladenine glycosylase [Bacteroidia bacterium]